MRYYSEQENQKPVNVSFKGIGFCSLLTIVFIVLKLCNVIDWAWVWVLFPTILSVGLWVILLIATIIAMIIISRND